MVGVGADRVEPEPARVGGGHDQTRRIEPDVEPGGLGHGAAEQRRQGHEHQQRGERPDTVLLRV